MSMEIIGWTLGSVVLFCLALDVWRELQPELTKPLNFSVKLTADELREVEELNQDVD